MKKVFIILFSLSLSLTVLSQKSIKSESFNQWNKKSRLDISINYDHVKYDYKNEISFYYLYQVFSSINNDPSMANIYNTSNLFTMPFYKINNDNIKLKANYNIFPFLSIFVQGEKIYSKSNSTYEVIMYNEFYKRIKYSDKNNGWGYGFGGSVEYFFYNFIPKFSYTLSWVDVDGVNNKLRTNEYDLNLVYQFNLSCKIINKIDLNIGVNHYRNKYKKVYGRFILPTEKHKQNESDLKLFTLLSTEVIYGGNLKYDYDYKKDILTFESQEDEQKFEDLQEKILKNEYLKIYFPFVGFGIDKVKEWGMTTGFNIEFPHNIAFGFKAGFLGYRTTFSTSISYRLFGRK